MRGFGAVGDAPLARLQALKMEQHSWPEWIGPALTAGPALVAVATFVDSDVERPALLAVLLAVSLTPWLLESAHRGHIDWPAGYVTLAAMAALHLGAEPLGVVDTEGGSNQLSLLILTLAVGETAATRPLREVWVMTSASVVIASVSGFLDETYDAAPIWTASMFIGLFAGLLIRRLLVAVADLAEAQAALEADAAARERQRIAREVHDVIAHSLTVTMLHITAARLAVGRGDADGATEALEEAERLGRRSLDDIRSTVGLLRTGDGDTATAAALPVGEDLDELVAGYRAAGLSIEAAIDPGVSSLPAAVGLATYRIVQEALANVAKHAPGARASVEVRVGADLLIDVHDDGGPRAPAGGAPGHGILGMRERAEALGGTLDAGPSAQGWRLCATIPLQVAAAARRSRCK